MSESWLCARCHRWSDSPTWCRWCFGPLGAPGADRAPLCSFCHEYPARLDRRVVVRPGDGPVLCIVCEKRRELPPDMPPPSKGDRARRVVVHGPWLDRGGVANRRWYWCEYRRPPKVPEPFYELVQAPQLVHGKSAVCLACGCVRVIADAVDFEGRAMQLVFYGVDLDSLTLPRDVPNCEPLHHPLSRTGWGASLEDPNTLETHDDDLDPFRPL